MHWWSTRLRWEAAGAGLLLGAGGQRAQGTLTRSQQHQANPGHPWWGVVGLHSSWCHLPHRALAHMRAACTCIAILPPRLALPVLCLCRMEWRA